MKTGSSRCLKLMFIFIFIDKSKAEHRNIIDHKDVRDVSITNSLPQPNPLVNIKDTVINNLETASLPSPTSSGHSHRHLSRNRTVFSPRGPANRWEKTLNLQTTKASELQNSTLVGILTGATIVFMLVWLPCYLYSETCLRGRSDNASQGSSENLSEDLEAIDHPPSYHEALSSRTVSTFSFAAQEGEDPPPSYDSLNVLIQNLDKTVCRVTSSTSYYSYQLPSQTARVSSSRSFHGTSSQFAPFSIYKAPKKFSSAYYKRDAPVRSLSFMEQPTLTEIHSEHDADSNDSNGSSENPGGTTSLSENVKERLQRATSKDEEKLNGYSMDVFQNFPDYPPPTYREECGSPPSSDSSSFLTVIEVNSEPDDIQSSSDVEVNDAHVVVMNV
ncbi:uncharacterized protein LOC117113609 [Anneissia japonica]|uniref:uncharacterized protein LOC117113609 n=1 Tax=Anneissia japonica TaxID=1529436 RepID=UPI00142553EB|nr:uncharacterized protein LOC117113609 [Anneissia japonica]XP_033112896.1 uncharacterized protein LOC117113609 [Anneissia japonica]XP_033112897.1 uncharacterized protein LOC117113609 [Anneissia japonica]